MSGKAIADFSDDIDTAHGKARQAHNAMLREMHTILKKKEKRNSRFGGLVRVQNKRREFMWVHPNFRDEY